MLLPMFDGRVPDAIELVAFSDNNFFKVKIGFLTRKIGILRAKVAIP